MKEPELQEWACRLLEDQLMRLAELRNANPRDPSFKLWRQTTLTVVQRVWPGNLSRSERFRRIPFTAPSARPTRPQVREHFERGCGEATTYLRDLITEIQNGALDPARAVVPPRDVPAPPPSPSQISASLAAPLPGEMESAAPAPPSSAPVAKAGPPPAPIPGFQSSSLSAAAGQMRPPAETPSSVPSRASSPTPARPPASEGAAATGRAAKPPRKSDRRALKEMLGFVDEPTAASEARPPVQSYEPERPGANFGEVQPPLTDHPEPAAAPPIFAAAPPPGATPVFVDEPLFYSPTPLDEPDELAAEEDSLSIHDEGSRSKSRPHAITAEEVEQLDEDDPAIGADPAELLRSSAWTATPGIAASPKAAHRSPVAATLQALASEVAELGVPEGKRAAARAALSDLARQIEERSADWDTLRDAFGLAMEYPPLARRVVPLLVPFLDLE